MAQGSEPPDAERAESSLAADVATSGLWSVAGQVAALGATMITAPFTIRLLGPAKYGLWALLQSLGTYFIIADLGMAGASTKFAAERYAKGDPDGESTVIWTALATTICVTGLAAGAVVVLAPFVVTHVLHVHSALRSAGTLAVRLLTVGIVAYAAVGCLNTPQQVRLRYRSVTIATSGPMIVRLAIAPVLLATVGGGVITMTALLAAGMLVAAALNFAVAVRLLPALRRPHATRAVLRKITRFGGWLAVSTFLTIPLTTAERFFLAGFHSPVSVAYYAVAASLGSLLAVLPTAFTVPLVPALTRHLALGDMDQHRRLYQLVLRGLFLCGTPMALGLGFIGAPFLSVWAGRLYGVHSAVPLYIMLAGLWFNTLGYVPTSQLVASGAVSRLAVLRLVELVPYLGVAALLTAKFGAVGAATAWTIRMAVDAVILFGFVWRQDRLSWIPTPERGTASIVATGLLVVALIGVSAVSGSVVFRGLCIAITLTIYGVGIWKVILSSRERAQLLLLARSLRMGTKAHTL